MDEVTKEVLAQYYVGEEEELARVLETAGTLLSKEFMETISEIFAYQGFDPKVVYKQIKAKDGPGKSIIRVDDYTHTHDFKKDMVILVQFFVSNGSRVTQILKSSDTRVKVINAIIRKYGVCTAQRRPGESIGPKVVTLSRISACFPFLAVDCILEGKGKNIVSREDVGAGEDLSRAFLSNHVLAVFPLTYMTLEILAFFLLVRKKTDRVLHRKEAKETGNEELGRYICAALRSPVMIESTRVFYFASKKGALTSGTGKEVHSALTVAARSALKLLTTVMTVPERDTILNEMARNIGLSRS